MKENSSFPYVWKNTIPGQDLTDIFNNQFTEIRKILLEHGAILFKSFDIDTPEKLADCTKLLPGKSVDYAGGNSPRTNLLGEVYTSTEHPAHTHISLHNELSYAHNWPSYILFCCHTPAAEGGHTIIANSRSILNDLSPKVKTAFGEKGVKYIRNLHGGRGAGPSWQETFETEDKVVVEEHCKQNDIQFEWLGNKLRLTEKRQAIIQHAETAETVWFNQADQFHPSTNPADVYEALLEIYEDDPHSMPQYVCFNDGSEIPLEMLEEVRQAGQKNTAFFDWEKGDLLLLDNILTAHGRTPFKGERRILVSMVN